VQKSTFLNYTDNAMCDDFATAYRLFLWKWYKYFIYWSKYMVPLTDCTYTGYKRRNEPDFGRVFLRSNYTDITQNTYIQS